MTVRINFVGAHNGTQLTCLFSKEYDPDSEIIQYASVYRVYDRCCLHNHYPRIMQDTLHFLL